MTAQCGPEDTLAFTAISPSAEQQWKLIGYKAQIGLTRYGWKTFHHFSTLSLLKL
jgi:hypothetical protein